MINGQRTNLGNTLCAQLAETYEQKGRDGFRVLALAIKDVTPQHTYTRADEVDMVFMGFVVFHDPARRDTRQALKDLQQLGVALKVITGDNRYVTSHLAAEIGLNPSSILTGEEISQLRDEALWVRARETQLFVEIDPQQKERIVRALQRSGHCVGFLGDGINDVPALEAADVGISVRSAIDVARESADIVLFNAGLDVLRKGIEEGRRTVINILKYLTITTSANFGNMLSMALITPWLSFLALAPKQILLNNVLSDLPAVLISSDRVDQKEILKPVRWNVTRLRRSMLIFGLHSSVFDILTFMALIIVFGASEPQFQATWFLISLLTELAVIFVLRTEGATLRSPPGKWLVVSAIMVACAGFALVTSRELGVAFGFVPLDLTLIAYTLVLLLAFALSGEWLKRYQGHESTRPV
jgi:P-type Mg2+ transporter